MSIFKNVVATVMLGFVLSGCGASSGPTYNKHQASVPMLKENQSRVFFFRESRFMSGGIDAQIYINNKKEGECANDAYFYTDINASKVYIKAESKGQLGSTTISKVLENGQKYYFEMLVNESYVKASLFGLVGQSIYVENNDNSSGWFFKEIASSDAEERLKGKSFTLDGE